MWTAEGDATGLEGDGPCRADVNTPAAVDTLMIAHTIVIDANGIIVYNAVGSVTYEALENLLSQAEESAKS